MATGEPLARFMAAGCCEECACDRGVVGHVFADALLLEDGRASMHEDTTEAVRCGYLLLWIDVARLECVQRRGSALCMHLTCMSVPLADDVR